MKAYEADLAFIHDVGYGDFAKQTSEQLLKLFAKKQIDRGLVVDLGCGSGIWASKLLDAGYDVLGVDISSEMINLARKAAPKARFVCSSFLDVQLPQCSVVTSLGECLCYLFDEKNELAALEKLFRRVYDALEKGGLFIFDVVTPKVRKRVGFNKKSFWESDEWSILVEYFAQVDQNDKVWRRGITTFRKVGKLYRRSYEVHRQRLYKSSELAPLLRSIGFSVHVVKKYGDYTLLPGRLGFIARKK